VSIDKPRYKGELRFMAVGVHVNSRTPRSVERVIVLGTYNGQMYASRHDTKSDTWKRATWYKWPSFRTVAHAQMCIRDFERSLE
jgi:hypothetical protein